MGFSYKKYDENDYESIRKAREAKEQQEANKISEWNGGTYGSALNTALDKIMNREKFSYDLNGDALYNQYKNQYMTQGKLAMADTIGQASSLTGGYGNSYAATVGNQAYQGYLQGLNDKVPELYQLALDKYNREGEDLQNQYALLANQYGTEYGEYRDKVADYNTELERLTNAYNTERSYNYGLYTDAYNRALGEYQQAVSEDQAAKDLAYKYASLQAQKDANDQSKEIDSLKAKLKAKEGYLSAEDYQKAASSDRTKKFISSIYTQAELTRRGYSARIDDDSKEGSHIEHFDNYTQYVDAALERKYANHELTENEVAYLKGLYNIQD